MRRFTSIFVVLAVIFPALVGVATARGQQHAAGRADLKISLDSAYLLMGQVTDLHVNLTVPAGAGGHLWAPGDTLTKDIEVARVSTPDTASLPGGALRISQNIKIQSFDSGNYIIPPVMYINGRDTVRSNSLALKVIPCQIDSLADAVDYVPVMTLPAGAWDWVPDVIADYWWAWVAGLLLIIGLVAGYLFWWRKRPKDKGFAFIPKRKPLSPYELAMQQLQQLRAENLCENGQEKEFYTRLTDILRQYIDSHFKINALEMTTSQILRALKSNPETQLPQRYMKQILEIADYVKFAKMRPFSEDNARAMADAEQFVRDTRPVEQPADDSEHISGNTVKK